MATSKQSMLTTTADYDNGDTSSTYYDYDEDYEDELCNKTDVVHFGAIFNTSFFSVVVALSLFGNVLVVVILAKYENIKSLINVFTLNLAVSDLIFTVGLPFWAYEQVNGWTLGETACKAVNFVFYVGFYSSGILVIMMTAHRYVAVARPLSNLVSDTKGFYGVLASIVVWTASLVLASPAAVFYKVMEHDLRMYCDYKDNFWKLWGTYQQNVLFVLTLLVVCFCYTQILCRLCRPNAQRRRHKTLNLIFTLVVVFFVGWAPYNIVIFLRSISFHPQQVVDSATMAKTCESYSKPLDYAFYVSRFFAFSHCCLNPVFYVFVGVKFQSHMKSMLKGWGRHRRNSSIRSQRSRLTTITSLTSGEEFSS